MCQGYNNYRHTMGNKKGDYPSDFFTRPFFNLIDKAMAQCFGHHPITLPNMFLTYFT